MLNKNVKKCNSRRVDKAELAGVLLVWFLGALTPGVG